MKTHSIDEGLLQRLAQGMVALARNPDAAVYRSLADILLQLGRQDEALEMTSAGTARFPADAGLHLLEGDLLLEAKDFRGALASAEKSLQLYPDNIQGLWLAARLHRHLGQTDQAIAAASQLVEIKPDHLEARNFLAALGVDPKTIGRTPAQDEAARKKQTITTATLAEIYVKQGYLNKAIQVYREILGVDPSNAQLLKRLRDLETQLAAPAVGAEESEPASDSSSLVAQGAGEEPARRAVTSPQAPASFPERGEDRVLDVFQGWLDAIRQRRSHVH